MSISDEFQNIYNKIQDELYYKPGDKYHLEDNSKSISVVCAGFLTSGQTIVGFGIALPKQLKNITSVTVNKLIVDIRLPSGGYLPSILWDAVANADSISTYISDKNYIRIDIISATLFKSIPNNTALTVNLRNEVEIEFS